MISTEPRVWQIGWIAPHFDIRSWYFSASFWHQIMVFLYKNINIYLPTVSASCCDILVYNHQFIIDTICVYHNTSNNVWWYIDIIIQSNVSARSYDEMPYRKLIQIMFHCTCCASQTTFRGFLFSRMQTTFLILWHAFCYDITATS